MNLRTKRILVTGGAGFLGSHMGEALEARGCRRLFIPRSRDYDLRREEDVDRVYAWARPEVVFHLAAVVGGSERTAQIPGSSSTTT